MDPNKKHNGARSGATKTADSSKSSKGSKSK